MALLERERIQHNKILVNFDVISEYNLIIDSDTAIVLHFKLNKSNVREGLLYSIIYLVGSHVWCFSCTRTAVSVEGIVRQQGATPATVGILQGVLHVGRYRNTYNYRSNQIFMVKELTVVPLF